MSTVGQRILVDGHVHFHGCFDAAVFLDAASRNFETAARALGLPARSTGCLLFTESSWDHYFRAFRDDPASLADRGWTFERTAEEDSLLAVRGDATRLVLVAGRQVVTGEGLEVLALGTAREFRDGLATRDALAAVQESGAVAALPWGFGKWTFARRTVVRELLDAAKPGELFLGDNGGRLRFAPTPGLFRRARAKGIGLLPGTDPLPFRRQNTKVGSYGFVLEGALEEGCPAKALKSAIRRSKPPFTSFGALEGLAAFCRDQLAMQRRKRLAGGTQ